MPVLSSLTPEVFATIVSTTFTAAPFHQRCNSSVVFHTAKDVTPEMKVGPGSMGHWVMPYKVRVNWVQVLILILTVLIKNIIE